MDKLLSDRSDGPLRERLDGSELKDAELRLGTRTLTARAGETRTKVARAHRSRLHWTRWGGLAVPALDAREALRLKVRTGGRRGCAGPSARAPLSRRLVDMPHRLRPRGGRLGRWEMALDGRLLSAPAVPPLRG